MLKLLSVKERAGKVCAVCGETRSVKYKADIYGDNDEVVKQVHMCNTCALELNLAAPKYTSKEAVAE